MAQTHIELTDEQITALEKLAKEQNKSLSQLIQDNIEKLIAGSAPRYTPRQKQQALDIVGKFKSGLNDLSTNHDQYFTETTDQ